MPDRMIPLVDVQAAERALRPELEAALVAAVQSGRFVMGPEVETFERAFASYCGTRRAVGVASGTAALHLALRALGVGRGERVVTVSHTFTATAEAIAQIGAVPHFVDVDEVTGGMDPKALVGVLEGAAAVIPVHLYGQPADMVPILALAGEVGVPVLEDAAQAHGALVTLSSSGESRRVGGLGVAGAFSFYPAKNLGAFGDAGGVTTQDEGLAERVGRLRDHGRNSKYEHAEPGFGERLDTLQAAVLSVKLRHLDAGNVARSRLAARYHNGLKGVGDLVMLPLLADRPSVWHLYVVRTARRNELLEHLHREGVGAGSHYPIPLHLQPAWRGLGYAQGDLPVTERWAQECLSLPLYPELSDAAQDQVIELVRRFFRS